MVERDIDELWRSEDMELIVAVLTLAGIMMLPPTRRQKVRADEGLTGDSRNVRLVALREAGLLSKAGGPPPSEPRPDPPTSGLRS
ncbi:MAG: hypothetical protein ACE5HQ_13880 [Gemmatimonadota bacterium]